MAKNILNVEYDFSFTLVGISCHEKDYRISWSINSTLKIDLAKTTDLKIVAKNNKTCDFFSLYVFDDEQKFIKYYLISNKVEGNFLVPEQKQADYFLLLKGNLSEAYKKDLLLVLRSTPGILTAFEIDPKKLKSKDNFLF